MFYANIVVGGHLNKYSNNDRVSLDCVNIDTNDEDYYDF